MNYKMKNNHILSFYAWLHTANISSSQKQKILERIHRNYSAYEFTFAATNSIRDLKNALIDRLEQHDCDIKAYNPEGWVRYADNNKKFGNIKLVPRHKWTP